MPVLLKQAPIVLTKPPTSSAGQSAWDFTDGLKCLLYGQSGTGKTTFWATFPGPVLALICSGGNRPGELRSIDTPENRKKITARIITTTEQLKTWVAKANSFATVVMDHVTGLQDMILKEILNLDSIPVQKSWGLATQQDYGQCTLQTKEFLRELLGINGHTVFIGQERSFGGKDEGFDPEIVKPTIGVAVTPSLAGWLQPACDYVMQTFKRPKIMQVEQVIANKKTLVPVKMGGIEYCLRLEPHETYMTKYRIVKGQKELPKILVNPSYAALAAAISASKS